MNICFSKLFFCLTNIANLNTSFKNRLQGILKTGSMVTEVHLTLPFGGKLRSPREGKKQTSASWEGPGSSSEQVPLRWHSSSHPCLQSPVHNLLHPLPPPILIAHPEPFYPEPPKPSLSLLAAVTPPHLGTAFPSRLQFRILGQREGAMGQSWRCSQWNRI